MNDDLSRFRANCFQFACDKLDPEEHAWMLGMLARHPEWQADVDAERELVRLAREGLAEHSRPVVPFDDIRKLMAQQAQQTQQRQAHSLGARLAAWWQRLSVTPASNGSRWAVAAVVTLGVALVFQGRHLIEREGIPDEGYRTVQPAGQGESGLLLVKFRDDVALGSLATRLEAMHLRIRSGPTADGVYELAVTDGELSQALNQLRESGLASEVKTVDLRSRDAR